MELPQTDPLLSLPVRRKPLGRRAQCHLPLSRAFGASRSDTHRSGHALLHGGLGHECRGHRSERHRSGAT
ncbi:unnamed protein product [Durusdinium trenchii]|uniref:Uncharacterized protein n=1 Tax=Durusdinium trenchii TaxID=1381693 RepID=A0ABP0J0V9_9DINO